METLQGACSDWVEAIKLGSEEAREIFRKHCGTASTIAKLK